MLNITRENEKMMVVNKQPEYQISYDDDGCSCTEEFDTEQEMLARVTFLEDMGCKVCILPKDK